MGVRVLYAAEDRNAVLYCSTTAWAFGPMFRDDAERDGRERAEAFLRWLRDYAPSKSDLNASGRVLGYKGDPRALHDEALERAYTTWLAQEQAQKKVEGAAS